MEIKMSYSNLLLTASFIITQISLHPISTVSTCGPKFPDECQCGKMDYNRELRFVVNCTNVGFRNTSVLEYMPERTEVLIFTGNRIEELPWNVFGAINDYENLEIIDMSNNHIHEIRGKSYHHVSNVKRLILNHNNLSISRYDDDVNHHHPRVFSNFINLEELHLTDAFLDNTTAELSEDLHDIFMNSNLTKLKKLHLEQNEIERFKDRNVFCDLPSLMDLYMGDNNLKEINFNTECLKNLRFLDLQRNKFEYIKSEDLELLDKLERDPQRTVQLVIDFNLNPLICDCKINPLHMWMKTTAVIVRNKDNLMCFRNRTYPELISTFQVGKCEKFWRSNDTGLMNNFNSLNSDPTNEQRVFFTFMLTSLCFVLVLLVITLIYYSRDKIKYLTPILDTVSKKVQYTTIKDEECPEVHL